MDDIVERLMEEVAGVFEDEAGHKEVLNRIHGSFVTICLQHCLCTVFLVVGQEVMEFLIVFPLIFQALACTQHKCNKLS